MVESGEFSQIQIQIQIQTLTISLIMTMMTNKRLTELKLFSQVRRPPPTMAVKQ